MNKSHHGLNMIHPNLYSHYFIEFALLVYSTKNISSMPLSNYDLLGGTADCPLRKQDVLFQRSS
jgi:hypothetical protein